MWTGRPLHHYAGLGTTRRVSERTWAFDEAGEGALLRADELQELVGMGLHYVILDEPRLGEAQERGARKAIGSLGGQCTDYDEWGGLSLCSLPVAAGPTL